jgi:putative tRNA adenosine deaminase-associated protein
VSTAGGTTGTPDDVEGIDFALAAYREDGEWKVREIAHSLAEDVEALATALRRFPGDVGALALVAVDEDFFLIVRVDGTAVRLLLSDVTAADEWEIARSAVEQLGLPYPEEDDDQVPAGDLDILGDLGVHADELGELLDDDEAYPDEVLSDIARLLGFGETFDDAVGLTSA